MSLFELVSRFVAGGTLVVLISLIGKSRNSFIAGLAMLFPAITLLGYYFLASAHQGALSKTVMFSIWSLPTSLVFLLTLYYTIDRISIFQSLALGLVSWLVTAVLVIGAYKLLVPNP